MHIPRYAPILFIQHSITVDGTVSQSRTPVELRGEQGEHGHEQVTTHRHGPDMAARYGPYEASILALKSLPAWYEVRGIGRCPLRAAIGEFQRVFKK
jgi:hypothetical protein